MDPGSMYRGYPVGELMFWENREAEHSRPIGGDGKSQDASMQVVDGQQRLTSLYAVVKGERVWREDYSREQIVIAFNPLTERFDVPTPIIARSPEWIADIVTVFGDPIKARRDYLNGLRKARASAAAGGDGGSAGDLSDVGRLDDVTEVSVEEAINRLRQLLTYRFQVVQIKEYVSRETVADVFVRINSEGVNLSSADFILTWMSVFWEEGRARLEEFARNSRFTPVGISQVTGERVTWTPHNAYLTLEPGQVLRVAIGVGLRRAEPVS